MVTEHATTCQNRGRFFKLYNDGGVVFYELLVLEEEEGSLSLKVKHFGANFHAWESKEDFINFKLVKIEPDAIHFSGISFYPDGPDKVDGKERSFTAGRNAS